MCLLHTAYHPGCCPSYLFYFSNSSPIELYIQRHERLWLSEALLDFHSCRWKTLSTSQGCLIESCLCLSFFSQGKATCVVTDRQTLKRCLPAFSERPWIRQMETSSWKSHGGQGTGLHQRMTGCDMCRWVCAAAYEPCSLMCTMSTQRACVCLRVPALAHDKGTWLCTCSAFSTVRQQILLPLNLWYIHKGLYKSIGCDG